MTTSRQHQSSLKLVRNALRLMKWLGIAFALGVAALNVQPYLRTILFLASSFDSVSARFLFSLPVLGGILTALGGLITLFAAVVFWAFVQLNEILPDILKNNRDNLKHTVSAYREVAGDNLSAKDDEPGVIQMLVEFYNNLPAKWIQGLFNNQKVAFFVDFGLSFIWFQPLKTDLFTFFSAPNVEGVDWSRAILVILCVLTANFLLHIWYTIEHASSYVKQERSRV